LVPQQSAEGSALAPIQGVGQPPETACGIILPPPRGADLLDLTEVNEQIATSSRVSIGDSQKYSGPIAIGPTILTRTEPLP
jgi:hypothetical protein